MTRRCLLCQKVVPVSRVQLHVADAHPAVAVVMTAERRSFELVYREVRN